jgi:GntR family transcriptional regulator
MSKLLRAYDRSRVPLYLQVASVMRQRIEDGYWVPGQKISTLVELEDEFQVARVTVRQAVDMLSKEGLLDCQQGRGTFVASRAPDRHWLKLATDWDVLVATIRDNVVKQIKVEDPPPAPTLGDGEGSLAEDYVFLRSCQFRDGEPYGLVSVHLARHIFDRDPSAFTHHTALPTLGAFKDIKIAHAHQTLVIGSANPETSDHLRIALGAPTAECRCVVIDEEGVAIYVANMSYRGDVVKLHVDLLANGRSRSNGHHSHALTTPSTKFDA